MNAFPLLVNETTEVQSEGSSGTQTGNASLSPQKPSGKPKKNNTTLNFLSICHSLLDCIQTLLFSNVTKPDQLNLFQKILQCNLLSWHQFLADSFVIIQPTLFHSDSHYSSLQSLGITDKLLHCLLTQKPGPQKLCNHTPASLMLSKKQTGFPELESVELFRGLKAHFYH